MIECPSCEFENADQAPKCQKCQAELFGRDSVCAMPTFGGTSAGQVLDGRYVIAQKIGDDGAGILYQADDAQNNTPVLIRALPTIIPDNTKEIDEIRRRAKALLYLAHENIVPLLGFQLDGPVKYFVSQQVQGPTLAQKLARTGPLTTEQAEPIFAPLGDALDYAHSQNHLHCDIHPGNIVLTQDGPPKIANFEITRWIKGALAKATGDQPEDASLYSAPEQFRTGKSHPRSDIYSFAATIYHSLCRPPVIWRGWIEYQILNEKPTPLNEFTDRQNTALLKALSRDSRFRYRSTYKFLKDLNLASEQTAPQPLGPTSITRNLEKQRSLTQQAIANLGGSIEVDLKEETEAKPKAQTEETPKTETEARLKAETQARLRAERIADAEEKEKEKAQQIAQQEAKARRAAEEKTQAEAEKLAREKLEKTQAQKQAAEETEARKHAEEKAKEEAKKRAEETHAKEQAQKKAQEEAKAREIAEQKAKSESEKLAAEKIARTEAEKKAEVETKARKQTEQHAKDQAEKLAEETRAKNEAQLRADTEARAKEEAQRRVDTETRAKTEAQQRAAKETQARKIAEQQAKEETEKLAAEKQARVEAEKKAATEAKARKENEEKARAEAKKIAQEEAEKRNEIEAQTRQRIQAEENARIEAEEKTKIEQEKIAGLEAKLREKDISTAEKLAKIETKAMAKAEKQAYEQEIAQTRKKLEEETAARAQAEEELAQQIKAKAAIEEQAKEYARELVLAQTAHPNPELETNIDEAIYTPPILIDQQAEKTASKLAKIKKIIAAAIIIVITTLATALYLNAIKAPPQAEKNWAQAQLAAANFDYLKATEAARKLIIEFPEFAKKRSIREIQTRWIKAFAEDKARQIWQQARELAANAEYEKAIEKADLILTEHLKTPYAAKATASLALWRNIVIQNKQLAKLIAQAKTAQDAGDIETALKAVTSALEIGPGNATAAVLKVKLEAQKQQQIRLQEIARQKKLQAQTLIAEALAHQSSNNFPRAIDIYAKAAELTPDDPQIPDAIAFCSYSIHLSNGHAALSTEDFDAAMQSFEKASEFANTPQLKQNLESIIAKLNKKRRDRETRLLVIQWLKSASQAEETGDLEAAVEYYRKAADANDLAATHKLALAYYNGNGIDQNITDALQWFEKAAEAGNSNSMFRLGLIYHAGDGVEEDGQKAAQWYQKAANAKHPEAMHNLGAMYYSGQGVVKDVNQALNWLEKAARAGNVQAMYNVAVAYYNGEEITQDYGKAVEWFRKAADANDVPAMYNLALAYLDIADYTNAKSWFQKAANANNIEAMYNLGVMYYNGYGVNRDFEAAGKWYIKAAEKGETNAMVNLGLMHEEGLGTPKDTDKAVQWYRKAADANNPRAMSNLAMAYYQGQGLQKDTEKAITWLKKAADLGETMAMFNLALMYQQGKDLEKDTKKAAQLYEKTAQAGDPQAMVNLALMYKTGKGVEKDLEQAQIWLKTAADLGHKQAIQELKKLQPKEPPPP